MTNEIPALGRSRDTSLYFLAKAEYSRTKGEVLAIFGCTVGFAAWFLAKGRTNGYVVIIIVAGGVSAVVVSAVVVLSMMGVGGPLFRLRFFERRAATATFHLRSVANCM